MNTRQTPRAPRPTAGQRRILQWLCRPDYTLGVDYDVTRRVSAGIGEPQYSIRERGSGRHVHTVAPALLNGLLAAGWIERRRYDYTLTREGVAAANAPQGLWDE